MTHLKICGCYEIWNNTRRRHQNNILYPHWT